MRFVEIRYAVSTAEVELALTTETTKLPKLLVNLESPFGVAFDGKSVIDQLTHISRSKITGGKFCLHFCA